jgi:hypothetical protein
VELIVGRNVGHTCFRYFAKPKIGPKRVSKSYNHDQEVHVCGYVMDEMESKDYGASFLVSPF